jgi:uroporphyrin-III C-methyltransferase
MTWPLPDLPVFEPGWVWLVGAGPGDPGLLTAHALNAINQADVIVYDALVNADILALRQPSCALEYAGKRGGKPSTRQQDITLRLIAHARQGLRVLRLKGGDPFVFGRGGEEALALVTAGIRFRVVPGISAGIGALAYAGIPLTHRDTNQAVTFVTGHDSNGEVPSTVDWPAIARTAPVIVIYMALKHLARITAGLIAGGRRPDEPTAIVRNATLDDQRVIETRLEDLAKVAAEEMIEPPAIIVVGEVVRFRQWLKLDDQAAGADRENRVLEREPLG